MSVFFTKRGVAPKQIVFADHLVFDSLVYIDTEFTPNQDTRVVMDCEPLELNDGGKAPFGARTSFMLNAFAAFVMNNQVFWNYGADPAEYQFAEYTNAKERMTIDANRNVCTFEGSQMIRVTLPEATFAAGGSLLLGCTSANGSADLGTNAWVGKIYSCQVYDNDVLIRDFYPAFDPEGVPCMYDKLNKKCYYGKGHSELVAG